MKRWVFILIVVAGFPFWVFLPVSIASGAPINAGFVSGIWYSKTPFFAGDQIRIYSAIHNQSGFDLVGKLKFFDGNSPIGDSDFSVINGMVIERWVDWKVTAGDHLLYVKIVDAKKSVIGRPLESVTLQFDSSVVDKQFADVDTDGDGVPDAVEIKQGTNPLKKDINHDGIPDGKGTYPLRASEGTSKGVVSKGASLPTEAVTNKTSVIATSGNVVMKTVEHIDSLADSLKSKVETKEGALRDEFGETASMPGKNDSGNLSQAEIFDAAITKIIAGKEPARNVYLAGLSGVAFILGNKFIFYPLLLIISFFVLRRLFHLLRPKK